MRLSLVTIAFILASLAVTASRPAAAQGSLNPIPAASVERNAESLSLTYDLASDAPVWVFVRSSLIMETREPWRLQQWRVATPGVRLDRVGAYDVLRATDGGPVPRRVQIEVRPRHENLEADYSILMFTDGSIAIPSGIFDLFPVDSIEAAAGLPPDLNGVEIAFEPTRVQWSDRAGPVLFMGSRATAPTSEGEETYVLFGPLQALSTERLTTVVDPQLPGWIADEIRSFALQVADVYVERLGPGAFDRPTIYASWNGPTPGVTSLGGSVMPGLIAMGFEGSGVLEAGPEVLSRARWFISHEAAHFWLGQVVSYEVARESWITEGGADLMAFRATATLDAAYDLKSDLQSAVDDCAEQATAPIATAGERGAHRAYYACGAVFALIAEGAQQRATGGDWFDFLRPLIDASREDRTLTRHEWLSALTQVSSDPSLAVDIELMLDHGVSDPHAAIADLFARVGVGATLLDGRLVLD